ncbi:Cro/CI family transcriptional regulator [Providencia rettgeri]|uniref:Cro/CI family transcriptional regulator n=1 Tax=Providencia rettgeri TaxID=587 RepID=UPI0018A0E8CA|nr:Cro/CI family transcriptional regulator [Providencia rettgeri]ELR5220257.1 helix-turn-helix domain-containing protein [Providencia rettgeri]MDX7324541.1 Cro/CI family transcriptional regulator [Providencia rettgeri]QPE15890.1 helix-turn-helix domain-containing protein [Providencia rettgeri]HEM7132763.1 helix-turn-helix domain-containing protein [Providencia rettgeri]
MIKEDVIKYFGSQRAVAEKLNVSDAAVHYWKNIIPEKAALKLSRITAGKLKYQPELYSKVE